MKGEDGTIGGQQQDDGRYNREQRSDNRSDNRGGGRGEGRGGGRGEGREHRDPSVKIPAVSGVTLGDMLKDAEKAFIKK